MWWRCAHNKFSIVYTFVLILGYFVSRFHAENFELESESQLVRNVLPLLAKDSDPFHLGHSICRNRSDTCMYLTVNAIEKAHSGLFNKELHGWHHEPMCNCFFPPRQSKLPIIQLLHIPKTGSSINWVLHGYFDNCTINITTPCPHHLTNSEELSRGLCNGRLFSCAGHGVSSLLPEITLSETNTFMFTILRDPWSRLQSSYYYLKSNPNSDMLSPDINTTEMLQSVTTLFEFVIYPGINNCMTKMLNGYRCGSRVSLTLAHLATAKRVLITLMGFGITELFDSSICLFSWMYGGTLRPHYFQHWRSGSYSKQSLREAFTDEEILEFMNLERFDLELYQYAVRLFRSRMMLTECRLLEKI